MSRLYLNRISANKIAGNSVGIVGNNNANAFGGYEKSGLIFQLDSQKDGVIPIAYGGYIKTGLVLQLDCSHYQVGNKTWTPIVNSTSLSLSSTSTFTKDEKGGVVFDGTKYFSVDSISDDYVIEVCFKSSSINSSCYLFNAHGWGYAGVCLCKKDGDVYYVEDISVPTGGLIGSIDGVTTLSSMIDSSLYKNGEIEEYLPFETTLSIANDWCIGKGLIGSIYSIRVYEKSKYDSSVASYNYARDLARFSTQPTQTRVFGDEFAESDFE